MAFEGAMKAMGSAKPKMAPKMSGTKRPEPKEGKVEGEKGDGAGDAESTTIQHNSDGTHTMDGETHPDHLHLMAAIGHKVTGGDKHHVAHHDGMNVHTHGIHESGEHSETQTHGSGEEAGEAMKQFMGDGEEQQQEEPQHSMGSYGG